jgi:hypothetical protein
MINRKKKENQQGESQARRSGEILESLSAAG